MRVCLISEKPSLSYEVLPVIREMHPDLDVGGYACAYVHPYRQLNAAFDLPRGLAWKDYPFSGEPDYRGFALGSRGADGRWYDHVRFVPDLAVPEAGDSPYGMRRLAGPDPFFRDREAEAFRRMRDAQVIYAAVDTWDSHWHALDRFLGHLALEGRTEVRIPIIRSLGKAALTTAFKECHAPGDRHYRGQLRRSRVARRFEYGFRVNSLAVMGRTMAMAGAAPGSGVPSKFGLQVLYMLRERGPLDEGRCVDAMQRWKGTGKYAGMLRDGHPFDGMGSPASRAEILRILREAGLLEIRDRALILSPLGNKFLDALHPDCEDPDLAFRIEGWKLIPDEAEANARVDRYLRTFFGKQIRRLARDAARGVAETGKDGSALT